MLLAALALVRSGAGLAADATQAAPQDVSGVTTLDEVIVTGKLDTLSGLRAAIKDSEQRFYARYNELNRDRRYDIVCHHEAPTGSRLSRDTCQAQVVEDISAEQAQAMLSGHPGTVSTTPLSVLRGAAAAQLRERTLQLLKSDPELMRDLLQHAKLEGMYQQMVRTRFAGWPGVH